MPEQPTPEDQLQQLAGWLDAQAAPVTAAEARASGTRSDADTVGEDGPLVPITPIDSRPRGWKKWASRHPIALVGAAAALLLIAIFGVVALGSDGDGDANVEVVDQAPPSFSLLAVTSGDPGQLVELTPEGHQFNDLASGPFALSQVSVSPDGASALVTRSSEAVYTCESPLAAELRWYDLEDERLQPLEGAEEEDLSNPLGRMIDLGDAAALSPETGAVAYMAAGGDRIPGRDDVNEIHDPCADGRQLVVGTIADGVIDELGTVDLVDWPNVQDLAWFDAPDTPEMRTGPALAVLATDLPASSVALAEERGRVIPASEQFAYIQDISVESLLAGPPTSEEIEEFGPGVFSAQTTLVPRSTVMASAGAGELLLAGSLDDAPFDLEVEIGADGIWPGYGLTVWRGDLRARTGTKLGSISTSEFGFYVPVTSLSGVDELTALDLAIAPDASVYVTVAVTESVDFDEAGDPLGVSDPSQVALFRITPDGATHKLADGIVSVAVRPGVGSPPVPPTTESPTTVGGDAELVPVPEVVGLQAEAARSRLEENGFVVTEVEESHPVVAVGEVIAQAPSGGSELRYGSEVTITVSTGPGSVSSSPTTTTSTSTSDVWLADVAYVTSDGSVVIDPADGEPRTIADLDEDAIFSSVAYPWGPQLTAAPDGRTLYAGTLPLSDFECDAQLYSIDVESGEIESVARGHSPAVSPDGTKLAFVVPSDIGDPAVEGDCSFRIEVMDLESGETKGWTDPWTDGTEVGHAFTLPNTLVWEPDSETLLFQRTDLGAVANTGGFDPDYRRDDIFSFSTNQPNGEVLDAQPLVAGAPTAGEFWTLVGTTSLDEDGPHAVVRATCLQEGCPDRLPIAWIPMSPEGLSSETSSVDRGGLLTGGDPGYLQYGICETPTILCLGESSWLVAVPPIDGGISNPVEIATDVVAAAWLP